MNTNNQSRESKPKYTKQCTSCYTLFSDEHTECSICSNGNLVEVVQPKATPMVSTPGIGVDGDGNYVNIEQPKQDVDLEKDALREIVISHFRGGDYACTRAWEAWQYGTMTQDDFIPLEETERVDEMVDLVMQQREKDRIGFIEELKSLRDPFFAMANEMTEMQLEGDEIELEDRICSIDKILDKSIAKYTKQV